MTILLDERGQPVSTREPWNTVASHVSWRMDISGVCVMVRHNGIVRTCHAKPHASGLSPQIAKVQELRAIIHKYIWHRYHVVL